MPDVVERVRVLVEGSGLSQADIAAKCGIGATTVFRWTRRHGWTRPAEAPRWTRPFAVERSGLNLRLRTAFSRLAVLASSDADRPDNGAPAGLLGEIRHSARRAVRNLARAGARDAPRLVVQRTRRRDRPRTEDVVERARDFVERTTIRQSDIARQLGVSKPTLIRWCQDGGWMRPEGAPSPFGGPARNPGWGERMQARIEARHRLGEAERLLDALGSEAGAGPDRIVEAARALAGVLAALRRRPGSYGSSL